MIVGEPGDGVSLRNATIFSCFLDSSTVGGGGTTPPWSLSTFQKENIPRIDASLRKEVDCIARVPLLSDSDAAPYKMRFLPIKNRLWQRREVSSGKTAESLFQGSGRSKAGFQHLPVGGQRSGCMDMGQMQEGDAGLGQFFNTEKWSSG